MILYPKLFLLSLVLIVVFGNSSQAQWLDLSDQTAQWLSTGFDNMEKDIATGDFNNDNLIDAIVVRKTPFSTPGAQQDLLLINTGSALEDQTAMYAPQFLSRFTDARDVVVADFDGDNWLDIVVASTFEDQPVFYRNLGENAGGNWIGFVDESAVRFPLPLNVNPLQFCAAWAGDVTGNGAPDLYFSNYDPGGNSEDVLLINNGSGVFTDESLARLGVLRNSAFGTSVEIHDMDGDGDRDIIKISTLFPVFPWNALGVFLLFNDNSGHFSSWQNLAAGDQPYMFTVTDLDNDDDMDVYIVDDQQDFYHIQTSSSPNVQINYTTEFSSDPRTDAFGGNCKFADLDDDGYYDLGVADVDVDIPPCETGTSMRKLTLMRNDNGILDPVYGSSFQPWNISAYDFAFLDINGDFQQDLFIGACTGYQLFIQGAGGCAIEINLGNDTIVCPGENFVIQGPSNFSSYTWSIGSTAQSISVFTPGTYCLTVEDSDGCTGDTCIIIDFYPEVTITFDEVFYPVCAANDSVEVVIQEDYPSYVWATGEETNAIFVFPETGVPSVTVTDFTGCTAHAMPDVEIIDTIEVFLEPFVQVCHGESVTIIPDVLGGDPEYLWSTGEETPTITISETGLYCVTVTDLGSFQCRSKVCQSVECLPPPDLEIAGLPVICGDLPAELSVQGDFIEFNWNTGHANDTILAVVPGTYAVTVVDNFGCFGFSEVEVFLDSMPHISLPEETQLCQGHALVLEPGQGMGMYSWSTGDSTETIEVDTSGEYCLTVINNAGCMATVCTSVELIEEYDLEIIQENILCTNNSAILAVTDQFSTYEWSTAESDTNRITIVEPGFYGISVSDQFGCSGDTLIEVVENPLPRDTFNISVCQGMWSDIWLMTFDTSFTIVDTITGFPGDICDSVITIIVNVIDTSAIILQETICAGDSFLFDGNYLSQSGDYFQSFTNAMGCDSTIILRLEVVDLVSGQNAVIKPDNGNLLGAIFPDIKGGPEPLNFLWSTGDTMSSITGLSSGAYSLTVSSNDLCPETFEFFVPFLPFRPYDRPGEKPQVFPNPFKDDFTIVSDTSADFEFTQVILVDIFGNTVYAYDFENSASQRIRPSISKGVYILYLKNQDRVKYVSKVIKVE